MIDLKDAKRISERLKNGYIGAQYEACHMFPELVGALEGKPKTFADAKQELADQIAKAQAAIRDILAPLVDDRLSGIEKQAGLQCAVNDEIRKRLHDLEAWKAEHTKPRVVVMGGQRSGKLAAMAEGMNAGKIIISADPGNVLAELMKFNWIPPESSEVDKFLDDQKIQVGDWVQVMGSQTHVFRVSDIKDECWYTGNREGGWHMEGNLQKLPEAEILARLNGGQA